MTLDIDLINGVALGIEYVPGESDADMSFPNTLIVDLLLLRFLLMW